MLIQVTVVLTVLSKICILLQVTVVLHYCFNNLNKDLHADPSHYCSDCLDKDLQTDPSPGHHSFDDLDKDLHAKSSHYCFDDLDKDLHTDPSHSCSTVVLTKICMLIQVTAVLSVFLKI